MDGALVLEDGTAVRGAFFGARRSIFGELVFNTNMTGYTEALTDPSYRGQILMMTYPLIGNYGVDPGAMESETIQPTGFVVKEACSAPSHPKSAMSLAEFLRGHETPAMEGADTRALTIRIRSQGTMKAALVPASEDIAAVARTVRATPHPETCNLVAEVSAPTIQRYPGTGGRTIVVVDCGVKRNILREAARCADVVRVPYDETADDILALKPGRVHITSQNHGFAVDPDSPRSSEFEVTHRNLNDGTVEGMAHRELPIFSVQYHPEAHPGPWDNAYIFWEFVAALKGA